MILFCYHRRSCGHGGVGCVKQRLETGRGRPRVALINNQRHLLQLRGLQVNDFMLLSAIWCLQAVNPGFVMLFVFVQLARLKKHVITKGTADRQRIDRSFNIATEGYGLAESMRACQSSDDRNGSCAPFYEISDGRLSSQHQSGHTSAAKQHKGQAQHTLGKQ